MQDKKLFPSTSCNPQAPPHPLRFHKFHGDVYPSQEKNGRCNTAMPSGGEEVGSLAFLIHAFPNTVLQRLEPGYTQEISH